MLSTAPEGFFHKETMNAISTYINEALEELRHVRWPTRQQAVRFSAIVIVFTAISGVLLGVIDYGLSQILRWNNFCRSL
jgi:preprotein translocase subunit SecE